MTMMMTKKKIYKLIRAKKSIVSNSVKVEKSTLRRHSRTLLFVVKAKKLEPPSIFRQRLPNPDQVIQSNRQQKPKKRKL